MSSHRRNSHTRGSVFPATLYPVYARQVTNYLRKASRKVGTWRHRRRVGVARKIDASHAEMSIIASAVDDPGQPSPQLISLLLDVGQVAQSLSLEGVVDRCRGTDAEAFIGQWPGEHYRLLAAMGQVLGAKKVFEIGTFTGLSALCLHTSVPEVTTNDVIPWREIAGSFLNETDFQTGIQQIVGDFTQPEVFNAHRSHLREADFIFIDGPKDGLFERRLEPLLRSLLQGSGKLVIWDDIRVMTMVPFWRSLDINKLDATSLGHWSGTGLIQY